jgi:hypothetical protein
MKIEIDDDCADMVVQESLVQTYLGLTADLKLNKLHKDDAQIYKAVVEAIEVLGKWYFAHGEFERRVKKT